MRELDNWSLALLAREATRNVMMWGARLFPLVLIAALLGSGVVALAVKEARDYDVRIEQLAAQGRNAVSVFVQAGGGEAPEPGDGIERNSCEGLNEMRGVEVAGLQNDAGESQNLAQLGALTQVRPVSATLLPQLFEYDLVIGGALAEGAGLDPDAELEILTESNMLLSAVVNDHIGPRVPSSLAIFPVLSPEIRYGIFCSVVLDQKADAEQMRSIIESSMVAKGGDVTSQALFTEQFSARKDFLNRTERFAAPAAGVFGGLILAIMTFMRSSELAAYRLSGTSPRSLGMMLSLEAGLIAGTFLTSAALGVALFFDQLLAPVATLSWATMGAAVWIVLAWILSLPVLRRKPSDMAKDR